MPFTLLLIKQARFLPLLALGQIILGLIAPEYSSTAQHISELGKEANFYGLGINLLALGIGFSLLSLYAGIALNTKRFFSVAALLLLAFALAMLSNGLFKMGSPLHGLFGAGMASVLVPVALSLDFAPLHTRRVKQSALIVSALTFIYLWQGVVGLEPEAYSGLLQRMVMLLNVSWFAYAASQWPLKENTQVYGVA